MVNLAYFKKNKNLWSLPFVFYLLLITLPGLFYFSIGTGLDFSYQYGLNYLTQSKFVFGHDVVFTYGPLGYLLFPRNIGSNLVHAMALWCTVHIIFALILLYFLSTTKRFLPIFLFIISYILVYTLGWRYNGMVYEWYLALVIGILFYISFINNGRIQYVAAFLAGLLAALSLFIKFNLGLSLIATIIVWAGICILQKKAKAWKIIAFTGITYLIIAVLFSKLYFRSYVNMRDWVIGSFEITKGFSTAMSAGGSRMILTLGFLALMIYVALLIRAWRKKWTFRFMGILFVPLIFVSFKHGFVRQDTHVMFFILFFLPAIGLLILTSIGQKEIKISVTAFVAMLILSLPALVSFNSLPTLSETKAIFSGESGKSFINSIIHLKETQSGLDHYSKLNLEEDRLPAQWLSEIGNATVDTIPWEICYCPANNLNWSPNPVLQIYSAYTSSLDLKSASHYDGVGAPHFLIAEFIDIDGRHPLLAEPATWHRIISNYDVIFLDLEANRFLLKKKVQHLEEKTATFSQGKGYINQWIPVPDSYNLLFASINMKQNIRGVASEALFRIPPVYIDLFFKSGRIASYRIIPDTAKNGVLINYIPYDIEELMKLFKGVYNDRVTKFKISGPGTLCYSKDCDIRWINIR